MRHKYNQKQIGFKGGQVTLFIIIALVVVGAIVAIFALRGSIFPDGGKVELTEVYSAFDNCIKEKTIMGLRAAGAQAGYLEAPTFSPGSRYAPFSSELNFFGTPVPYWYYVAGNNLIKEQVPSKALIEKQLEDYISEEIRYCDFSEFRNSGYIISLGEAKADVTILDTRVDVAVSADLNVLKGNSTSSSSKREHGVSVESKFGKFYNLAREIYDKEKTNSFLENYSVDILNSYAPVTGTELSCSPKIWKAQEVVDELKQGLSANVGALKVDGDYYTLKNKENKYFVIDDISADDGEYVSFMYDASWPTRIEVWPAENGLLVAEPVGLEQGMGIIGFCYVPYHFVYDVSYPVLIQIGDGQEIFQFPVAVIIDKNAARQAIEGEAIEDFGNIDEICNYKNTNVDVYTYNKNLEPVEADISFACFNAECAIGKTAAKGADAVISTNFPQCINGKIIAKAEGYTTENYFISTNGIGTANILMDKLYDLDLDLIVGGTGFLPDLESGSLAVISFESEKNSFIAAYPQQKKVKLSEGYYNITVQVFGGAGGTLTVPESTTSQCIEVVAPGLLGMFGKKNTQCFDVTIPAQELSNGLVAGGKVSEYILEDDLIGSKKIELSLSRLPAPSSLDQLQQNYELYSRNKPIIRFD